MATSCHPSVLLPHIRLVWSLDKLSQMKLRFREDLAFCGAAMKNLVLRFYSESMFILLMQRWTEAPKLCGSYTNFEPFQPWEIGKIKKKKIRNWYWAHLAPPWSRLNLPISELLIWAPCIDSCSRSMIFHSESSRWRGGIDISLETNSINVLATAL